MAASGVSWGTVVDDLDAGHGPSTDLTSYLPDLRRYARILTGSQHLGDALVSLTMEDAEYERTTIDKRKLYQLLSRIWTGEVGDHWRATERKRRPMSPERQLTKLTPRSRQAYLLVTTEHFEPAAAAQVLDLSEEELHAALHDAQQQLSTLGAASVLIIEDEPLIAIDLESIVIEMGHTVVGVARTRTSAVARAKLAKPSLILSDIKLADDSSGIDAVAEITKARDVPAIFITAYPERLLTGLRREPVFLIRKPFRADSVRAMIGQALFWSFDQVSA